MGRREADHYNLNEVSKEKQRFMSVGAGTSIVSNNDEWQDAIKSLRAKLSENKNANNVKR